MRRSLILNAEDDPADTLLPRLNAAGADLDLILAPDGGPGEMPHLPDDLSVLESTIRQLDVGLLVLDSLSAFIPAGMMNTPAASACKRLPR